MRTTIIRLLRVGQQIAHPCQPRYRLLGLYVLPCDVADIAALERLKALGLG